MDCFNLFDIGEEKREEYFFGSAVSGFGCVSCGACVSGFGSGSALFLVNVRSVRKRMGVGGTNIGISLYLVLLAGSLERGVENRPFSLQTCRFLQPVAKSVAGIQECADGRTDRGNSTLPTFRGTGRHFGGNSQLLQRRQA